MDHQAQVDHRFCYFVDAPALSAESESILLGLIPPGAKRIGLTAEQNNRVWVVPRLGTVSPWSSKATDIVHGCGLDQVRRIERGVVYQAPASMEKRIVSCCVDPLTESVIRSSEQLQCIFSHRLPQPSVQLKLLEEGRLVLEEANQRWGLALNAVELDYILALYLRLGRNPFQSELMMFAQVNSEHCRHKIFNADWVIDDDAQLASLFAMIRHTHASHPDNVLVAYHDNAAVIQGGASSWLLPEADTNVYDYHVANKPIVLKVETHNHPTAISPFSGAATGSGGEIRDEAATGRGAKSKAGLVGFSVSDLLIPGFVQPWERDVGKPAHVSSSFQIMLDAPIGAAAFNNEFGRPNICGYFRTFLNERWDNVTGAYCGYHKPIMIAGGIGNIMPSQLEKCDIPEQALLVVLGGPAFAIGLGGGSASSRASQGDHPELDFASVQRANPQMQRRCQEVITACYSQGHLNPILSIHDVGAGGLSNAMPELVESAKKGARLQLRNITVGDAALSPVEIWCNESQERFVLAISPQALAQFTRLCERERCPFAVIGQATSDQHLILSDALLDENVIDLPMPALFEKMPRLSCQDQRRQSVSCSISLEGVTLAQAAERVLKLPAVASKRFLITIGDRSVGGLVSRDQMVGPWQVPVADVAVTNSDFCGFNGEALAMGERAPIAVLDHAASARMAVAEALMNIAAASIENLQRISLSANWMAAPSQPGEGAGLFDAVHAIAMQMCPQLGIAIPVGKDSLSMQCSWDEGGQNKSVTSPMSLVITAAAAVDDVRLTLTPQLNLAEDSEIVFIDLSDGHCGLGGTALSQVYQLSGGDAADVHDIAILKRFFDCIQALQQQSLLLAYHDRSDGGLFATLSEMMFASHCGLTCDLSVFAVSSIEALFNEELGAVIQFKQADREKVVQCLDLYDLQSCCTSIARCNDSDELVVMSSATEECYREKRVTLQRWWEQTGYEIAKHRDNPECVQQEFDLLLEDRDPGLSSVLTFKVKPVAAPAVLMQKPKVAILREQGVNGHLEMAAAFMQAGFEAVDIHMSDIVTGRMTLDSFSMIAACGGFSYGDVLGAGRGWALTVLSNSRARDQFSAFFERGDTLTLGVCNGCQMLSQLKALIPGAGHWPLFLRNKSEQFEARYSLVEVQASDALWLQGMQGSVIPVVVSHGEGRAVFDAELGAPQGVVLRYVDHNLNVTERYPLNPNGSAQGVTGVCSDDGRALIMMPHPERVFRTVQCSWAPEEWGELSPWSMLFQNAWNLFR